MIPQDSIERSGWHRTHAVPPGRRCGVGGARDKVGCMNITQSSGCVGVSLPQASRFARLAGIGLLLIGGVVMCSAVDAGSIHAPQTGDVPPPAYECIAGTKHWIQLAPCPQVALEDPRDTSDDPSLNSEPERGSYVLLDREPVNEQPLDKSELCRKLDDNSIPIKHNGSSDVYERNLAKSKYCS